MKTKLALLSALILIYNSGYAQTFTPDAQGYISDPAFHLLIKTRNYQLVTAFDTLQRKPLRMAARAMLNNKWLFIDNNGKIISEKAPAQKPYYRSGAGDAYESDITISGPEGLSSNADFKQVNVNGKFGTVSKRGGKKGVPAIYDQIKFIRNGMVETHLNGKIGIARASGLQILPAAYTQIKDCEGCNLRNNLLMIEKNSKWGIAYTNGTILVPPTYENIRSIYNGKMMVATGRGQQERYGLIDSLGKILMPAVYSGMMEYLKDEKLIKIYNETENGARFGRATLQGKELIAPVYEQILGVSNGIIYVKQSKKTGALDMKGKVLLEPVYDQVFREGNLPYLVAINDEKYGLFDTSGKNIFPLTYDHIIADKQGFVFKKDDKWGIMDIKGKLIKSLVYDRIQAFGDYLIVSKENKQGIIDAQGKLVVPIKYDRFRNANDLMRNGLTDAVLNGERIRIDRYGNEYAN